MSFNKEGLHLWPGEACLVEELATELSSFDPLSLKNLVIIFPTQRLEPYFLSALARYHKVFAKPQIFSFENFVKESLEPGEVEESIISDLACELILASFLKEKKYKTLHPGDEHEIKQFFGEILEAQLEEICFEKMRETFREDVYASLEHLEMMEEKVAELESLYTDFGALLQEKQLLLKDEFYRRASNCLKKRFHNKEALPWSSLYIVGFTTLRQDFLDLVKHFLTLGKTSFWLTEAPQLFSQMNPLHSLKEKIGLEGNKRFCEKQTLSRKRFLKKATSPMAEVLEAYKLTKEYLNKGLLPSQIGILVSCENTYAALVRAQFEKKEVDSNIAVALKLSGTTLGAWLSSFMNLARGKEKKAEILDFLMHPLTFSVLKSQQLEEDLSPEHLSYALINTRVDQGFERLIQEVKDLRISEGLLKFYGSVKNFLEAFSRFSPSKTLEEWGDLIHEIFSYFQVYTKELSQDKGLSESLKASAEQFMDAVAEAYECFNPLLTSGEIKEFIQKKLLTLEVRSVGYPLEGVQILRLIESRYIPFEVVMILGCVEGKFPKKLPKDYILDNWIKKKVGLRGWEYVESLEDTTYHLLKKRIPQLELFYPSSEKGRSTIPSRFLEVEKAYGGLVSENLETEWDFFFSSEEKEFQKLRLENLLQVDGESLLEELSAKSVGFLLNCPYKFFLYSLKIEKEHLFEATDHLEEGKILHKILEIFVTGCVEEDLKLAHLPKTLPTKELYSVLLKRLKLITSLLFEKQLSRGVHYHLLHYAWPRFVRFLLKFYRKVNETESESFLSESFRELSFGGDFSKVSTPFFRYQDLEGKEISLPLRGSIDSLDQRGNHFLLIDYKRKTVPTAKDQSTWRDVQLLFYALVYSELQGKNLEGGLLGYWSIMEGKWNPRGVGDLFPEIKDLSDSKSLRKKSLSVLTEGFREKLRGALLDFRQKEVRFEKRPGDHCDRCEFFEFCQPEGEGEVTC